MQLRTLAIQRSCPFLLCLLITGVAVRPASNFGNEVEQAGEHKEKQDDSKGLASLQAPAPQPLDGTLAFALDSLDNAWQTFSSDQTQKWVDVDKYTRTKMKLINRTIAKIDMRDFQAMDTTEMDNDIQDHVLVATQDVVGSWRLKRGRHSTTFSILSKGTELVFTENRDSTIIEVPLHFSGDWWQGHGDVSIIGGGSDDIIRIRRRGDKLICNTKGPEDSQWRATIVAFKDGVDPAYCDDIVENGAKVDFAAAKRCLENTGFVHIQFPKGEHMLYEVFTLTRDGTVLLQAGGDKADTVLKCSSSHAAFELNTGAELLLEGLMVDNCGSEDFGAVHAGNKEATSLRLQRGAGVRYAERDGVRVWRTNDSKFILEDGSLIRGAGESGLFIREGKNNTVSLHSSTIDASGDMGLYAYGGENHRFSLAYSSINASGEIGISAHGGENHSFILAYSSINASGDMGLSTFGGKKHSFSLAYSSINASGTDGLYARGGENHSFILAYSSINASGKDGIHVHRGENHSVSLAYSSINASGENGIAALGGEKHSFSLAYSSINASVENGLHAHVGENHSFILAYSSINASGKVGLCAEKGEKHSFSLAYSSINASGENGLRATGGEKYSFSLAYSSINASGKDGIFVYGGKEHDVSLWYSTMNGNDFGLYDSGVKSTLSLGYSTISDSEEHCVSALGSILIGSSAFRNCGGMAVQARRRENVRILSTSVIDSEGGLRVNQESNVTIKNTTFRKLAAEALSIAKGLLYTESVSVYASGSAVGLGDVRWEGSNTKLLGNGNGIRCSASAHGTVDTSFVFLNGLYDTHNCNGLALNRPLLTRMHAETLRVCLFGILLLMLGATAFLPIIQDPPREFRDCSTFLVGFSVVIATMWLATIAVVLLIAHELFQREEHDEDQYGVDAWAWARDLVIILVGGIITTIVATVVAFLARKRYTFLRSTAQTVLDSEARRRGQQELAQQRGEYTKMLHEHHEAMVKNVSHATSCMSIAEGQQYFKDAQEQFGKMQKLARDNGKDLDSKLHQDVQQMYKDDPLRWKALIDVESVSQKGRYQGEHVIPFSKIIAGDLARIGVEELNEEVTRRLLLAASWGRSDFQKSLEEVAGRLNNSEHIGDIIDDVSGQYPFVAEHLKALIPEIRNLKNSRYKLLRDDKATLCGQHCNVVMGPNKTDQSALRKAKMLHDEHGNKPPKDASEWQMPAARYLLDLLRATVVFSDPVALVVYFHLLATEFTVMSTKNKYKEPLEEVGSPSILVNIEIDTILGKLTAEVQLYLDKFVDLKFMAHTNYEVDRVKDLQELLSPFQH